MKNFTPRRDCDQDFGTLYACPNCSRVDRWGCVYVEFCGDCGCRTLIECSTTPGAIAAYVLGGPEAVIVLLGARDALV